MGEVSVYQKTSVTSSVWDFLDVNTRSILTIKQKFNLSEIVARILINLKIPVEDVFNFLYPTLKDLLPDPFHLLDMDKAVFRIEQAINKNENIVIFGDYDVDGATSSALIKKYLKEIGIDSKIYIPDRIKEGYGPNTAALLTLAEQGYTLCITVDCGTLALEPISQAQSAGLDIIVVDHHLSGAILPEAVAVINPNRLDECSSYRNLAAVGVSFLLLVALNRKLRQKGFFLNKKEPNLINFLDLVALGTVCDVMQLTGLNRAFVSQGLKIFSMRKNLGLKMLSDVIGIDEKISTYHLGFVIGPHINSGGRIGQSNYGAELLSTENIATANDISQKLQVLNLKRKEIESASLEEAFLEAEKLFLARGSTDFIIVSGPWHPGIIGIVAGRLKEKFYLPTIVISLSDGIGKASCRSVEGVDMGSAVISAKLCGIIIEGGGHQMAAGFSILEEKIEALYEFLSDLFKDKKSYKTLKVTQHITVNSINSQLWGQLQLLEPFGTGNPDPRFVISEIKIKKPHVVGVNHVRCFIYDDTGTITGISFRACQTNLGNALFGGNVKSILGKITANYWRGVETLQFLIEDAMI